MISDRSLASNFIPYRRFGRTGLQIPILSLGTMRFQQSWQDVREEEITNESQKNLEASLRRAFLSGMFHVETARHYGSSERQLGLAFQKIVNSNRILQSKVPPKEDPREFEDELRLSFQRLRCKKLDLHADRKSTRLNSSQTCALPIWK